MIRILISLGVRSTRLTLSLRLGLGSDLLPVLEIGLVTLLGSLLPSSGNPIVTSRFELLKIRLHGRDRPEGLLCRPMLSHGAAPRDVNQSNGSIQHPPQPTSEVITDGGTVFSLLGNTQAPVTLGFRGALHGKILLGLKASHLGQTDEANFRMVNGKHFEIGISGRAECPFHVALTTTNPDLANQHVLYRSVAALARHHQLTPIKALLHRGQLG